MSTLRAKDLSFSTNDQASQTMVLDIESTVVIPRVPDTGDDPTLVLDMTATQVGTLLGEIGKKG